ncbi:hypothetical protein JFU47_15310 [Pseudomonas sp. TH39(2020)]|uniref:DUF6124 family protein n=1 Tax=Pseudomonas sp. TH39(2020) TaxID=2796349 RepID=UPI001911DFF0|nr:DUF6124 family protein [Pseudomonas sp. TH39(2020)]MBK5398061.1 hypothetical protein [Pseudomonas sp. TH39(2020)]
MFKPTPNPPDSDPVTPSESTDSETRTPSKIFFIAPETDNRTLLEYACESLASANVMASDFARYLEGSQSNTLLGIQQSIMLGELAVNRVLDNLDPP